MEKINSKNVFFRIAFTGFLVIFFLTVAWDLAPDYTPTFKEVFRAVFEPFEHAYNPFNDIVDAFQGIYDFFNGGSIADLLDLFKLFILPFKILGNVILVIIDILRNLMNFFL